MALIVEDGTGFVDSESYISVADAAAYHVARNNDAWASGADVAWEGALRRATEWIDANYRARFSGYRTKSRAQALEWPRTSAYYVDRVNGPSPYYAGSAGFGFWTAIAANAIPVELQRATAEAGCYARQALQERRDFRLSVSDLCRYVGGRSEAVRVDHR
jgi:hypothetical protein